MGVMVYTFNFNISPKMSYGVFEYDIAMLENYMLMILYKRSCNKKGALFVPDPVVGRLPQGSRCGTTMAVSQIRRVSI